MGRLEIRVCGARNIANTQKVGTPDPYVKVKIGEKKKTQLKFKTRIIENSLNPVWNELFKFQVADYDATQIIFEVWNDNVMVDDMLGNYSLSINGLTKGVVEDMWVILAGSKKSTPELHLRVLAVDFGKAAPAGAKLVASLEDDNMTAPSSQTTRPHKTDAQLAAMQSNPSAPQGLPQPVSYGGGVPSSAYAPQAPVYVAQQPQSFVPAPQPYYQQPPQQSYYAPPPQHQPMYGAPQTLYGAPPPQTMYAPPPQPMYPPQPQPMRPPMLSVQMAYGVPPEM